MALRVMENSFSDQVPNTNVYIPDVSIPEALTYKKHLEGVSGVSSVLWLDDVADTVSYTHLDVYKRQAQGLAGLAETLQNIVGKFKV